MSIFKIIYYIFTGLVALIAVLLIISTLPITGNYKVMTVLSGSMEPEIKTGSIVVVKPVSDYKIGDIITFVSKGNKTPITHRVEDIEVIEGVVAYITKGDANNAPDSRKIAGKEIIGKVLFTVPYIGYAVDVVKKPIGFMIIIIIPAAIIVFDELKKVRKEIITMRSKKREQTQDAKIQANFEKNKEQDKELSENKGVDEQQGKEIEQLKKDLSDLKV
ncbi:MAG: signal peptidase I [bacterium]